MMQLIKNELINLRAQKSYLVLSCLVLAVVIVVSFVTSVAWTPLLSLLANGEHFITNSAGYQWAVKTIDEDPDSALSKMLGFIFRDPQSKGDMMRDEAEKFAEQNLYGYYEYCMAEGEFYDFADAHDMPDWAASQSRNTLVELYSWRNIVEGLESGKYTPDDVLDYLDVVMNASFADLPYYIYYDSYDYETDSYVYEFHKDANTESGYVVCTYTEVLAALVAYKPVCAQMIELAEKQALELTADAHYDTLITELGSEILEKEFTANLIEQTLQDPTQNLTDDEIATYEYTLKQAKRDIENLKTRQSAFEYLKEHELDPDSYAYQIVYTLLHDVLNLRSTAQDMLDQENLIDDSDLFVTIFYQARANAAKLQIQVLDQAIVVIEHAYQNNLLLDGMSVNSAKSNFTSNLATAAFMVTAVSIVLASMILSREFATGTVRLWVIRPKTRSKLLMSKIVALLIYIVSMMLICFGITYAFGLINHLIDLFFFGESTLFLPRYEALFGLVLPIPAILEHLWTLVVLTLPVVLFAMVSFFISVLTKKGVLGIVLGMLTLMFASDIQMLVLMLGNYTGAFHYVLQLTVLPYLHMETLLGTALEYAIVNTVGGSAMDMLNLGAMLSNSAWGAMPYVFSSAFGAVVLLVHIGILIFASLAVFKKTQIKS